MAPVSPMSASAELWCSDLGTVPYLPTVELQRRLRTAREHGAIADTLLVLEHDPVITTGHRTEPSEVAYALTTDVPVVPTERGGKATYHGPGQIVVYPVFDLAARGGDIKQFVCTLERALINTLARFDINAARRVGLPGVWVENRKIASIGIRVTRWISYHGIALNVSCDLEPFSWFTPCGIPEVEMTSVARERASSGQSSADLGEVRAQLVQSLLAEFAAPGATVRQVSTDELAQVAQQHMPSPGLVPVESMHSRTEALI